jgi:outer membrane lipoprotein-sorting protein
MKIRRFSTTTVALFAVVLCATSLPSAFGSSNATDAQAAFAKLKGLSGQWEAKSPDGSKSQVQYEVVSATARVHAT